MSDDYQLTLNDYLQILRGRAFQIATILTVLLTVTVVVTMAIPPIYESAGTILIESQEIPTDLVRTAVNTFADERIQLIKQRVMTHENLSRLIDKYQLYKNDLRKLSSSEVIDEMRDAIDVELLKADVAPKKGNSGSANNSSGKGATIAFTVAFDYKSPETAFKVTNDLVTLFLDENIKSRTEMATETTEFLSKESDRLKQDLEKIENQVVTYKQEHLNALPENNEVREGLIQRTQTELSDLDRESREIQGKSSYLKIELTEAKSGIDNKAQATPDSSTPTQQLDTLKQEYDKLTVTHNENYPDVRALKMKIGALEKSISQSSKDQEKKGTPANAETDLEVAKVQAEINTNQARLDSIEQQKKALNLKLSQLDVAIQQGPQVENGLLDLQRDYETAKTNYDEVLAKEGSAKIAQNLEESNKGEKFSLIDPPQLPDLPIKPNRIKIFLLGAVLSIGVSIWSVIFLESQTGRIWGVNALAAAARQHPLAVIPYFVTPYEKAGRKRKIRYIAISLVVSLFIAVALVHILYLPLDVLFYKILARFE